MIFYSFLAGTPPPLSVGRRCFIYYIMFMSSVPDPRCSGSSRSCVSCTIQLRRRPRKAGRQPRRHPPEKEKQNPCPWSPAYIRIGFFMFRSWCLSVRGAWHVCHGPKHPNAGRRSHRGHYQNMFRTRRQRYPRAQRGTGCPRRL